jgi:hypothetical protein
LTRDSPKLYLADTGLLCALLNIRRGAHHRRLRGRQRSRPTGGEGLVRYIARTRVRAQS